MAKILIRRSDGRYQRYNVSSKNLHKYTKHKITPSLRALNPKSLKRKRIYYDLTPIDAPPEAVFFHAIVRRYENTEKQRRGRYFELTIRVEFTTREHISDSERESMFKTMSNIELLFNVKRALQKGTLRITENAETFDDPKDEASGGEINKVIKFAMIPRKFPSKGKNSNDEIERIARETHGFFVTSQGFIA